MLAMYLNGSLPKDRLLEIIYSGKIWLNTKLGSSKALCDFADRCVRDGLGDDPRSAHKHMPVEDFVPKVGAIKQKFTNSDAAKECIREFLQEVGQDPQDYIFDVPRLRVVPNYEYLHAGVSYAYKPHRDLWYGGPNCQVNTWMPVYPIDPSQTMMINPAYFDRKIANSSGSWDLKDWIDNQRAQATQNVKAEARPHPEMLEDVDESGEIRVAGECAETLIFSGAHLHGTIPNQSDTIRFSIDFRVFNKSDLQQGRGATNVDSEARNIEYGFRDYYDAATFARFPGVA